MAWRAIKSPRPYRIRVSGRVSRRARGAYCRALIVGGRVALIAARRGPCNARARPDCLVIVAAGRVGNVDNVDN